MSAGTLAVRLPPLLERVAAVRAEVDGLPVPLDRDTRCAAGTRRVRCTIAFAAPALAVVAETECEVPVPAGGRAVVAPLDALSGLIAAAG